MCYPGVLESVEGQKRKQGIHNESEEGRKGKEKVLIDQFSDLFLEVKLNTGFSRQASSCFVFA